MTIITEPAGYWQVRSDRNPAGLQKTTSFPSLKGKKHALSPIPLFSNSFLQQRANCPSLHQRKQTLASTNSCRRLSEWETAAAVHRTQELPSSCSRASRRILHVGCSHLAVLLCARLLAPPSASECSSCACWLLLVVRGCLCSILPPSLTRVLSQSLASRGSSVSLPAAEATRGVVSCFVAFRGWSPTRRRPLAQRWEPVPKPLEKTLPQPPLPRPNLPGYISLQGRLRPSIEEISVHCFHLEKRGDGLQRLEL
ncbi:uncharacterized protein LOC110265391 [Arachis ipaensis]|uniref:uncharacterized protein LOC110265391 n=1 Tax=Arachis ipaensis TaxID=130454 RepID=UPI000A2B2A79|nr:uncharacterized protein LOC110265391 [Arachis ipaensis]